jgi:hypothetical protein
MDIIKLFLKLGLLTMITMVEACFIIAVFWPVILPDAPNNPLVDICNALPFEMPVYVLILAYAWATYTILTPLVISYVSI